MQALPIYYWSSQFVSNDVSLSIVLPCIFLYRPICIVVPMYRAEGGVLNISMCVYKVKLEEMEGSFCQL